MAKEFEEAEYTKADFKTWKQVLSYMSDAKRDVILLFITAITLAVLDTTIPQLNGMVIDEYVLTGNLDGLKGFGILYLLVIMLFGFIVWSF
ncbi:ABC transporter ATP-binding protein, partial [Turicibacter sanguinis]|nr:ABC transporter ATP-binding protein [Turicibacter sanguinis]